MGSPLKTVLNWVPVHLYPPGHLDIMAAVLGDPPGISIKIVKMGRLSGYIFHAPNTGAHVNELNRALTGHKAPVGALVAIGLKC